mmetsp:Transcript_2592/g.8045  ORF Transcript_2592/g.8045 Transcript_2592/m.8045 type:complete len:232 (+) Transcript_2592:605-1300(+)
MNRPSRAAMRACAAGVMTAPGHVHCTTWLGQPAVSRPAAQSPLGPHTVPYRSEKPNKSRSTRHAVTWIASSALRWSMKWIPLRTKWLSTAFCTTRVSRALSAVSVVGALTTYPFCSTRRISAVMLIARTRIGSDDTSGIPAGHSPAVQPQRSWTRSDMKSVVFAGTVPLVPLMRFRKPRLKLAYPSLRIGALMTPRLISDGPSPKATVELLCVVTTRHEIVSPVSPSTGRP